MTQRSDLMDSTNPNLLLERGLSSVPLGLGDQKRTGATEI